MKEIGGYFQIEEFIKNEYYKELISLNSGRNALLYLIKSKKIKKIYIPYYLCDSITIMLEQNNILYEYYRITEKFKPLFNKELLSNEYIYIVNFFGQISNKEICSLKEIFKNIIIDNTHAFYQSPLDNIDTIYNCRKWFGVSDGAYLSTNKKLLIKLENDKSALRLSHLTGRYEGEASEFYLDFIENDKKFKHEPLKYMSKLTKNFLGAIDYKQIEKIRKENFNFLSEKLENLNNLEVDKSIVPFVYPLYIENAEEIRKKMIEKKIYIPLLWPNVVKENSSETLEYKFAKNILPIPCDQRYTIKEMKYIIQNILEFIKEKK